MPSSTQPSVSPSPPHPCPHSLCWINAVQVDYELRRVNATMVRGMPGEAEHVYVCCNQRINANVFYEMAEQEAEYALSLSIYHKAGTGEDAAFQRCLPHTSAYVIIRQHMDAGYQRCLLLEDVTAILRLYSGSFQALLRLYSDSFQALLRLYSGSFQALLRLYSGFF